MSHEQYEVYALRYASRGGRASSEYYRYAAYGEADGPANIDYYFWLVRNAARTILVDCGLDQALAEQGRYHLMEDPVEVLSSMGVVPEDVDHVLITHMHSDHVGNLHRFPKATFSLSRREYKFCMGETVRKGALSKLFDLRAVDALGPLEESGRLHVLASEESLFPGVQASWVGGHSPGQLIVQVATSGGVVVLTSDATHFYDEFERDRPFRVFTDLEEVYRGYERLRALAATPGTTVAPGHDPAVMRRFAVVHPGAVVDLGKLNDDPTSS